LVENFGNEIEINYCKSGSVKHFHTYFIMTSGVNFSYQCGGQILWIFLVWRELGTIQDGRDSFLLSFAQICHKWWIYG